MASGLPEAKWNNADVVDSDVDVDALIAWYAERGVPWGVRVPLEFDLELGAPLFVKRCAALVSAAFRIPQVTEDVSVRRATQADLDVYAATELARFGGTPETELRWLSPAIGASGFTHWIAERSGAVVGVAMTILTDELAGPAAYLGGIAVIPAEDGRGIEQLLVAQATTDAFAAGAMLVHTNPDENELLWLSPLGFVEVPGFLVRIVVDAPRRTEPQP